MNLKMAQSKFQLIHSVFLYYLLYAGNVMALDVNLVGVDSWSKMNPRFDKKLKDVDEVSDENLEKIIELEPDLIIGLSTIKTLIN